MAIARYAIIGSRLFTTSRSINQSSRKVPETNFSPLKVATYPYDLYVHPSLRGSKGPALSFLKQPSGGRGLNELAKIGWLLDDKYQTLSPANVEINPLFEGQFWIPVAHVLWALETWRRFNDICEGR